MRSTAARIAAKFIQMRSKLLAADGTESPAEQREIIERSRQTLERIGKLQPWVRMQSQTLGHDLRGVWIGTCSETRILFLHGGAYVAGSPRSHRTVIQHTAKALGGEALALNYRLAPEHPYPAAVDDAVEAYRWIQQHGSQEDGPPKYLYVAGDSAGGGLAVALVQELQRLGGLLPDGLVLLSPWAELTFSGASYRHNDSSDPTLHRGYLDIAADAYAGEHARTVSGISPVNGSFQGFPPMYIQVGGDEMLFDDALTLTHHARQAGVSVELDVWEDMFHSWQFLSPWVPEAREAFSAMDEWSTRMIEREV